MRRFICCEAIGAKAAGLALALAATVSPAAAQCAMCTTAAGSGDVGRGLSISVLFLLGILASLAGGLVVAMVRTSRRDADPTGHPAVPRGPDAP